jgi:hypothetical protein
MHDSFVLQFRNDSLAGFEVVIASWLESSL